MALNLQVHSLFLRVATQKKKMTGSHISELTVVGRMDGWEEEWKAWEGMSKAEACIQTSSASKYKAVSEPMCVSQWIMVAWVWYPVGA